MDDIIRQVQIDLITGMPNPIIHWFNGIWYGLTSVHTNVFHNNGGEFIYYQRNLDGHPKVVFFLDTNNGKLLYEETTFASIMRAQFNLGHIEENKITKKLVEDKLRISNIIPYSSVLSYHREVYDSLRKYLNEKAH